MTLRGTITIVRGTPQGASTAGAVAQLGERRVRNAKVRGSIPLGSTNAYRQKPKPDQSVVLGVFVCASV